MNTYNNWESTSGQLPIATQLDLHQFRVNTTVKGGSSLLCCHWLYMLLVSLLNIKRLVLVPLEN